MSSHLYVVAPLVASNLEVRRMEMTTGQAECEAIDLSELEDLASLLPDGHIEIEPTAGALWTCC